VPKIARSRGWLVTIITVSVVLVGLAATVFSLGVTNHAVASSNASAWLFSSEKGEVARANAETGRVDTRFKVTNAQGHQVVVSQTDQYLVLRDLTTGQISSLNLATLQIAATTPSTPGLGISVALGNNAAFIVDSVQGVVRQLNPLNLNPVGEPMRFPPGLVGGVFDDNGVLWLAVPSEGTLVEIKPGSTASSGPNAGASSTPVIASTRPVADPGHDLALSTLTNGVAVLDQTGQKLTTVRSGKVSSLPLNLPGPGTMPDHDSEPQVPVTVIDDRHVYVANGDKVTDFVVPGDGPKLEPAVAFAGRLYVADAATGTIYVLDNEGKLVSTFTVPRSDSGIELTVRGGHLFVNSPGSSTARVVDSHNKVTVVDKYANDVLGGDKPQVPPVAPPVEKPKPGPPGAPASVRATAGDGSAHITWSPANSNGSPIIKYVVEGDGTTTPHEVGASQRSFDATGLTNGQTYKFTVYAVNARGNGPKKAANPVIPTRDVPDAPASVSATAAPDGTVTVTWPAANGQGHPIKQYEVTSVSKGTQAPVGTATTTSLKIPAGTLDYGTQYAFTVVAINDAGASSKASPLSSTVVPFTKPGAVKGLKAATVDAKGSVSATWSPGADNGRAITGYQVTANGAKAQTVTGTSVTLTGFADGAAVSIAVAAVNEAGAGPTASASATTLKPPALTAQQASASYVSIDVPFTTNGYGGATKCTISLNGGPASTIGCSGGTVANLALATKYSYTVTATNNAGSDTFTGSQTTKTLSGAVICNDPTYCGPTASGGGIWLYTTPTQTGKSAGDAFNGDRMTAICWVNDSKGATINAQPYGGKKKTEWIKVNFKGQNYIPWAWFTLDAGDTLSNLPAC
jgi:Fibronectin type III domain